jgi:hypothetical protein
MLDGVHAGIDDGYFQHAIADAAYEFERKVNAGDRITVGVNPFTEGGDTSLRVTATSTQDEYWFGGVVLSIASEGPPTGLDGGAGGADAGSDGAAGDGGSGPGGGDGGGGTDGGGGGGNLDAGSAGDGSGAGGGDADAGDRDGPIPPRDGGGSGPDALPDAGALGAGDESVIAEGSGCQCGIGAPAHLPIAAALPWCVLYVLARARWRRQRRDRGDP